MDKDLVGIIATTFTAVAGILGVALIIGYTADKAVCLKSYVDYRPTYGFFEGCRIEYGGKLTPTDMIKNINLQ